MKNKRINFCCSLILLSTIFSYSQSFIIINDKAFGGDRDDDFEQALQIGINEIILAGYSRTDLNGDKTEGLCNLSLNQESDLWLLKLDTSLAVLWDKDIGGDKADYYAQPFCFPLTKQILLVSTSVSDSACHKITHNKSFPNTPGYSDYWLCLLDSTGNRIWDKTLGTTNIESGARVIQLTSGELVLAGTSNGGIDGDKTVFGFGYTDYWLVKLDLQGNKIWDKVYGGSALEYAIGGFHFWNFSLLATTDGGMIFAGSTTSPQSGNISQPSLGVIDVWLVKLDSTGTIQWDKRYGGTLGNQANKIISTQDGGYLIAASTNSPQGGDISEPPRGVGADIWLLKVDSVGNKQWDKRYGGNGKEVANYISSTIDGGYLISGTTSSDSSGEVSEPSYSSNQFDYWIIKVDSIGNKLWDKRFGGPGQDYGANFIIQPDSSIFLFGTADSGTSAVKTDAGKGKRDYWMVHFKYVDSVTTAINEKAKTELACIIAPNPTTGMATITITSSKSVEPYHLLLWDITGKELFQQNFKGNTDLDLRTYKKGIYIVEIRDQQGNNTRKKLVKI